MILRLQSARGLHGGQGGYHHAAASYHHYTGGLAVSGQFPHVELVFAGSTCPSAALLTPSRFYGRRCCRSIAASAPHLEPAHNPCKPNDQRYPSCLSDGTQSFTVGPTCCGPSQGDSGHTDRSPQGDQLRDAGRLASIRCRVECATKGSPPRIRTSRSPSSLWYFSTEKSGTHQTHLRRIQTTAPTS